MLLAARSRFAAVAIVCAVLAAPGCSTKVGKDLNPPPNALITPIGIQPTSGAGTSSVSMVVRSGSLVILSAKDSDGLGVALAGFHFTQTGGPPLPQPPDVGAMLYTTSNTVEFTAPQVSTDTDLIFQLTVVNALNVSSTATAKVTVTAANDANEFLIPSVVDDPSPPRRFVVALAPASGLTNLTADAAACVKVSRQLSYKSRDGTLYGSSGHPMLTLPLLADLQATATWRQAVGGAPPASLSATDVATALQSAKNPRVVFDVPAFNDVELAAMFNQPSFDSAGNSLGVPAAAVNQQLVLSDLDSVQLNLSISATAGACSGGQGGELSGIPLVIGVYQPGTPTVPGAGPVLTNVASGYAPIEVTADQLLQSVAPATASPAETLQSALAYYNAEDPPCPTCVYGAQKTPLTQKTTLNAWLEANCFDPSQNDYGTGAAGANGAHAVYTNNFDLGFGRDMYFIACAADHKDANGNVTAHAGDMAAVVINYGSLEQTALKQAPIIAVAMEYQGAGHTNGNCASTNPALNTCFTKFYVFAPDDRTGEFQRVSSANFDRRGEKYVPGPCLSCHGGRVTDPTFASANVGASFMPWDLDALLYSDTDPAFKGNLIGAAPYTKDTQAPNLTALNLLAWRTLQIPQMLLPGGGACPPGGASCVDRFAAPRALLNRWFGWCTTSPDPRNCAGAHAYDDNAAAPTGWPTSTPSGAPTTSSGAPNDLYHAVFAHHCRSCHTQNATPNEQFADFTNFQSYLQGTKGSSASGMPNLVFNAARMPLARLTLDRFWVAFDGSTSAAQRLAEYINEPSSAASASIPAAAEDAAGNTIQPPGTPVLVASVYQNLDAGTFGAVAPAAAGQTSYTVSRFNGARVDFSSSLFVSSFDATFNQAPSPPIVGANEPAPAFDTSAAGAYTLDVTAASQSGKTPAKQPVYTLNVVAHPPTIAASCLNISQSAAPSQATNVPLTAPCVAQGLEPNNGLYNLIQIQSPPGNSCQNAVAGSWVGGAAIGDPANTWSAIANTTVSNGTYSYTVTLTFNSNATAAESVTLCYRITDVDGNDPVGAITYQLVDSLQANNPASPLLLGPAPASPSYPILASALTTSDVILPASDTSVTLVLNSQTTSLNGTVAGPANSGSIGLTGSFSYTPPSPTFLTCDINGRDIVSGAAPCIYDTFAYYLLSGNGVTRSPQSATVSLNVQATTSFSRTGASTDIYQILTNCSSCHTSSLAGAVGDPGYYWQYTSPPANPTPAQTAAAVLATYNSIIGADSTTNKDGSSGCNNWTQCQNDESTQVSTQVGFSNQASLYYNPCDSTSDHYKNNFSLGAGSASCTALLQWVLEGAHDD